MQTDYFLAEAAGLAAEAAGFAADAAGLEPEAGAAAWEAAKVEAANRAATRAAKMVFMVIPLGLFKVSLHGNRQVSY